MTELERKRKYIEKAKAKHPNIKNESDLKNIADSIERKDCQTKSVILAVAGFVCFSIAAFFIGSYLGWILICLGGLAISDSLRHHKKVKVPHEKSKTKDPNEDAYFRYLNSKKTVVDSKYARSGGAENKPDFVAIIFLVMFVGFAIFSLIQGEIESAVAVGVFIAVICFLSSSSKRKKEERMAECVYNNDFKFLETTLTDKEDDIDASCDTITKEYFFIFTCEDVVLKKEVSRREFMQRNLGEPCYLLLFTEGKQKRYYIEKVIWPDESVMSHEMEGHMTTHREVALRNRR